MAIAIALVPACAVQPAIHESVRLAPLPIEDGLVFQCGQAKAIDILDQMDRYLADLGIGSALFTHVYDPVDGSVVYQLMTEPQDTNTLNLIKHAQYDLDEAEVLLPDRRGAYRRVKTVSQREIVLALMQHGRTSVFRGENCNVDALKEQVGLRQNIVAWAEQLNWRWPNGGPAKWNRRYWHQGTPKRGVSLRVAVNDAFVHQSRYSVGCYTASKLVVAQGVLDYYSRVHPNKAALQKVEQRLLSDGDPLVNVEPPAMWSFEPEYDPKDGNVAGKLLAIQHGIAPGNFVPGDWSYLLNTDPVSRQKTGYEGSNAIYLGRGKFDDYYNDNDHAYTYAQKLDEVYQWRNGVFSRARDGAKIQPLGPGDYAHLLLSPNDGGLLLDVRATPYLWPAS